MGMTRSEDRYLRESCGLCVRKRFRGRREVSVMEVLWMGAPPDDE